MYGTPKNIKNKKQINDTNRKNPNQAIEIGVVFFSKNKEMMIFFIKSLKLR